MFANFTAKDVTIARLSTRLNQLLHLKWIFVTTILNRKFNVYRSISGARSHEPSNLRAISNYSETSKLVKKKISTSNKTFCSLLLGAINSISLRASSVNVSMFAWSNFSKLAYGVY